MLLLLLLSAIFLSYPASGAVPSLPKGSTVPLVLGPTVPLAKGDKGADQEAVEVEKRDLSDSALTVQKNNLDGQPGQGYYVTMRLGTPGQKLNILIDTGSSNFAVAGYNFPEVSRHFTASASSTFRNLHTRVYLPYTQGSWTGQLGSDTAFFSFLPNGTQRFRADVAVITAASGFFIKGSNWEGIAGLAYSTLARPPSRPATPILDSLFASAAGRLPNVFSVQLCGSSAALKRRYQLRLAGKTSEATARGQLPPTSHGSFVIGGVDSSLQTGAFLFTPIRKEWYYEIVLTGLRVSGKEVISDCKELNFDKTIVDTGTTDLRLPERVFRGLVKSIQAVISKEPGTVMINEAFFASRTMLCSHVGDMRLFSFFPVLEFDIRISEWRVMRLKLSPQQYVRYVGYFSLQDRDCFKFGIQSSKLGTVLGAVFMEGFYTVFDRVNKRVGFAGSTCVYIGGTSPNSSLSGPFAHKGSKPTSDCAYYGTSENNHFIIEVVSIILGILCLLFFIPILILLIRRPRRAQIPQNSHQDPSASATTTPMARNDDRRYLLGR